MGAHRERSDATKMLADLEFALAKYPLGAPADGNDGAVGALDQICVQQGVERVHYGGADFPSQAPTRFLVEENQMRAGRRRLPRAVPVQPFHDEWRDRPLLTASLGVTRGLKGVDHHDLS